jgi:endogenous inhibitor of DNA gyrase (YacG/DUF329 family)
MARASRPAEDKVVPLRPVRACPICRKPSSRVTFPFCSKRCADVDLSRWLSGVYAIPAAEDEQSGDGDGGPGRTEA